MYGNDYTFVTFTWQTADFVFVKRSFPLNMRLPDTTVCDQYMKLFVHLTENREVFLLPWQLWFQLPKDRRTW